MERSGYEFDMQTSLGEMFAITSLSDRAGWGNWILVRGRSIHPCGLRTKYPPGNPRGESWLLQRLLPHNVVDAAGAACPVGPCRSRHWYSHAVVGINVNFGRARSLPAAPRGQRRRPPGLDHDEGAPHLSVQ